MPKVGGFCNNLEFVLIPFIQYAGGMIAGRS